MKLRLLVTDKCNRNCAGCCNKQWDLDALPVADTFDQYDTIMYTGGEPMLNVRKLEDVITTVMRKSKVGAKHMLYTANTSYPGELLDILGLLDGITITLHAPKDVIPFKVFLTMLEYYQKHWDFLNELSYRLNVFKEVGEDFDIPGWEVRNQLEWIDPCPLPKDEVFLKYKEMY